MALYEIHIASADMLGFGMIDSIIEYAAKGAVRKDGVLPVMKFPFQIVMTHETEEEPVPTPTCRVFNMDDKAREVRVKKVEVVKVEQEGGGFSMEVDPELGTNDQGRPFTKEELDSMSWDDVKIIVRAFTGQTGRDRQKLTKAYLSQAESLVKD